MLSAHTLTVPFFVFSLLTGWDFGKTFLCGLFDKFKFLRGDVILFSSEKIPGEMLSNFLSFFLMNFKLGFSSFGFSRLAKLKTDPPSGLSLEGVTAFFAIVSNAVKPEV